MPETVTTPLIEALRENRSTKQTELDNLLKAPTDETRNLTADEDATFNEIRTELAEFDARITQLVADETAKRAASAAAAPNATVNESNPVYRKGEWGGPSYFRDLAVSQNPNIGGGSMPTARDAKERLERSQPRDGYEGRAGDMNTTAGTGGEFAPPLWLVDEFIALARPGRPVADLVHNNTLPGGVSSINIPKVGGTQPSAGTAVGVQATQNSAITDTAMTTTSVSSGITTLAGAQIVSLQLLEQSGVPFDQIILKDLARAYAADMDTQVLYGSNASGQLNGLVGQNTAQAFTSASPAVASSTTANSLYYAVSKAWATSVGTLYTMVPTALVMHPRRWAWIIGSVDANSRPFVIPDGAGFNPAGTGDLNTPQGRVGTFGGIPVTIDANISTTANSSTNQDEIYLLIAPELELWESNVQTASFDATYANNLSMLFRIHGYAAFIPNRYTNLSIPIRGTGLVAPA